MVAVRVAAGASASILAAAAAPATTAGPTVWEFFGEPFQAAPTLTCICCALIARCLIALQGTKFTWKGLVIEVLTMTMSAITAAVIVQENHYGMPGAVFWGTGLGAIGIGIIGIAKSAVAGRLKAVMNAALTGNTGDPPPDPATALPNPTPSNTPPNAEQMAVPADMTATLNRIGTGRVEPHDPTADYGD